MIDREVILRELASSLGSNVDGAAVNPLGLEVPSHMSHHERVVHFRTLWQLYNLNRKGSSGTVTREMREAGFQKFATLQSEVEKTNKTIRGNRALDEIRSVISEILPPLNFVEDDLWPLCTFGPGTFHGCIKELKNTGYSLHYKVGGPQTCSPRAWYIASDVLLRYFPRWADLLKKESRLKFTDENRISYVPKDTRGARQISIEPSLNVFLQQGVGRWMVKHFREIGFCDLLDGQHLNAKLAGDLQNATIDLSNASDMISLELCREVLPPDWFELMNAIRSHNWVFGENCGAYSNFSSQGNAFTFPLETLIFKAAVLVATGLSWKEVTVYGDDIIIPKRFFEGACRMLETLGFTVNTEKSYGGQHAENTFAHNFRESCGADYYEGELVTPVYYREDAKDFSSVATLYNRLLETWGLLPRVHDYLIALVPANRRCFGPRFFISGDPDIWGRAHSRTLDIGFNKLVSNTSLFFWSDEPNGKYYSSKGRKIKEKDVISEEVAHAAFLLGDDGSCPRTSRHIISRKIFYRASDQIVSAYSACARGVLKEVPVWSIGRKA